MNRTLMFPLISVILSVPSGCAERNVTYQLNRARAANIDSRNLAEESAKAVARIDKINGEISGSLDSLRMQVTRVENQSARCQSEAERAQARLSKKIAARKAAAPEEKAAAEKAAAEKSAAEKPAAQLPSPGAMPPPKSGTAGEK